MFGMLRSLAAAVVDAIDAAWDWYVNFVVDFWTALADICRDTVNSLVAWVDSTIAELAEWFNFVDRVYEGYPALTDYMQYLDDVAWILPLHLVFTVVSSVYSITFTVRITRHILRLIPGAALG